MWTGSRGRGQNPVMCKVVMPETRPLCPGAESNLQDRALGEVEKNSSIALSIKEGHTQEACAGKPASQLGKVWGVLLQRFRGRVADEDEGVCRAYTPLTCLTCSPDQPSESLSGVQLCSPMDCSLPGSSVHGILQARILEWGAIYQTATFFGIKNADIFHSWRF